MCANRVRALQILNLSTWRSTNDSWAKTEKNRMAIVMSGWELVGLIVELSLLQTDIPIQGLDI